MIASERADMILALTRDARLAPYAMSAIPAWLWASDATCATWANAAGAGALGAATPAGLTERIFPPAGTGAAAGARVPGPPAPRRGARRRRGGGHGGNRRFA